MQQNDSKVVTPWLRMEVLDTICLTKNLQGLIKALGGGRGNNPIFGSTWFCKQFVLKYIYTLNQFSLCLINPNSTLTKKLYTKTTSLMCSNKNLQARVWRFSGMWCSTFIIPFHAEVLHTTLSLYSPAWPFNFFWYKCLETFQRSLQQ